MKPFLIIFTSSFLDSQNTACLYESLPPSPPLMWLWSHSFLFILVSFIFHGFYFIVELRSLVFFIVGLGAIVSFVFPSDSSIHPFTRLFKSIYGILTMCQELWWALGTEKWAKQNHSPLPSWSWGLRGSKQALKKETDAYIISKRDRSHKWRVTGASSLD